MEQIHDDLKEREQMNKLYRQNLQLGNRINILNDENNFYRIQINNFNKLTNSINKDLYKLGFNFQSKQIIGDSAKVGPLFVISNKIKLKNLQMKIGSSIRHTQKIKKYLDGPIAGINKYVTVLQQKISKLSAMLIQLKEENKIFKNIDYVFSIEPYLIIDGAQNKGSTIFYQFGGFKENKKEKESSFKSRQQQKCDVLKKYQFFKKEDKEKQKILTELLNENSDLCQEIAALKESNPENSHTNNVRADEAKQLQKLQAEEKRLVNELCAKSKELEDLYIVNKEFKQKINQKKYQEYKQNKVFSQEIQKCKDQVKQFKQKYRKIKIVAEKAVDQKKVSLISN